MPAVSKAQQEAVAIAEHNPQKLQPQNRGLLKMSHQQLHDFAATPTGNLPAHAPSVHVHMALHHLGGLVQHLTALRASGHFAPVLPAPHGARGPL